MTRTEEVTSTSPVRAPRLEARGLSSGYGPRAVVHDVDLSVAGGELVALLGANGVGKTTTMLTLAGEFPALGGEILIDGVKARGALHRRARSGLGFVPEGRSVFFGLSVRDNLRVAGADLEETLELFPELEKRLTVRGGLLSGGEQQMLALARALSRKPRVMLIDELSLGLGPLVVARLLTALLEAARREDIAVLFIEQHARKALNYADHAYIMRRGRIVLEGTAAEVKGRLDEVEDAYLNVR